MHSAVIDGWVVEHIKLKLTGLQSLKTHLDQQRVPFWVGDVRFSNPVPSSLGGIYLAKAEHFRIRNFDLMGGVFRFAFYPTLTVGNDELQHSRVRLIDSRIVNLVQNAVWTKREPNVRA